MKKLILSERNLVIILFVMVLVIFSLAQEDTRKIEKMYQDYSNPTLSLENSQDLKVEEGPSAESQAIPAYPLR